MATAVVAAAVNKAKVDAAKLDRSKRLKAGQKKDKIHIVSNVIFWLLDVNKKDFCKAVN